MEHTDLLISTRWTVPVEPRGVVLENHAVLVRDGRIHDLLPVSDAIERYPEAQHIDRPGHVLLPGLVNAHVHAAMTLFRGLADDLPLDDWLQRHIWPAENRWIGPVFIRDGTELAMAEMIRSGTTCCNEMYYFPDIAAQTAVDVGLRTVVAMIVIEQPTPWASTVEEYFEKGLAVHDQFRGHPLVRTSFGPHAPYTVSDDSLRRIRMLADELGTTVHMHVHETAREVADAQAQSGQRPLARLDTLGLVTPLLNAVHMTELDDDEIALLAERGASVVHCPESNLKLASGFCPVGRLLDAGVNVALGTDGAASNNDLDMFGEMKTAALLGKAVSADATAVSATQALEIATINGARALGLEDETGSLTVGKAADLICVDLGHPDSCPVYHPVSQLVYACGRHQVSDVWVAGRQLLDRGQLTELDSDDIRQRAQAWSERIGAGND